MLKSYNPYPKVLVLVLLSVLPISTWAQKDNKAKKHNGPAVFWHDPVDLESRNLFLGAGGQKMMPDIRQITIIEKKEGGYSTKYRVRDASGNEWIAKIGKEAQPDTVANRLLWAVGYETEIAYLFPHLTIGEKGILENVRLEARPKNVKRIGNWKWSDNPFMDKPEFRGLKIMMLMINNWDMKDENNQILATRNESTGEEELAYIISDLGASFGKTGGAISRSRNKPSDYVKADFIEKVNGGVIDFKYSGKNKKLFDNLTVADAQWLGKLLNRLSDTQLKDAFRAANYSDEETALLASAFKERINELADATK